jgi:hypothetical protein
MVEIWLLFRFNTCNPLENQVHVVGIAVILFVERFNVLSPLKLAKLGIRIPDKLLVGRFICVTLIELKESPNRSPTVVGVVSPLNARLVLLVHHEPLVL